MLYSTCSYFFHVHIQQPFSRRVCAPMHRTSVSIIAKVAVVPQANPYKHYVKLTTQSFQPEMCIKNYILNQIGSFDFA